MNNRRQPPKRVSDRGVRPWAASLLLGALSVLSSCGAPSVAPLSASSQSPFAAPNLAAEYEHLAQSGGQAIALRPKDSEVRIFAFRAGEAAKLGHNHVLSAPRFKGYFYLPGADANSARFDLEFRLDELEIDDPAIRSTFGPAFASQVTAAAVAGTREHMLGSDNLEADRYPFVRIHSLSISGEAPKFAARIAVELHGVRRQLDIPLTVDGLPKRLSVSGSFVLRQSDFGAKPYSVLGGLLSVRDEVIIEFHLVGG